MARLLKPDHELARAQDATYTSATQNFFYDDDSVLYISAHRPVGGSSEGFKNEAAPAQPQRGAGPGEGFTCNVGWPAGVCDCTWSLTALPRIVVADTTLYR